MTYALDTNIVIRLLRKEPAVVERFDTAVKGDADLLIAASCLVHGYILVTNNKRDFENIEGLQLEDWTDQLVRRDGQSAAQFPESVGTHGKIVLKK